MMYSFTKAAITQGLLWWLRNKESASANAGDSDSIPGLGRAPGEGNGNPLQYYCPGNPMDRGDWLGTVHGVTKELDTINCNNKALQTGWLQQEKFISSQFWRIEI